MLFVDVLAASWRVVMRDIDKARPAEIRIELLHVRCRGSQQRREVRDEVKGGGGGFAEERTEEEEEEEEEARLSRRCF